MVVAMSPKSKSLLAATEDFLSQIQQYVSPLIMGDFLFGCQEFDWVQEKRELFVVYGNSKPSLTGCVLLLCDRSWA